MMLMLLSCVILITAKLELQVWAEPGYFYGYMCELSFMLIGANFSKAENIHFTSTQEIGFEKNLKKNLFYVQNQDLRQYPIHSYDCPSKDYDICIEAEPHSALLIPASSSIWRKYNSTHQFIIYRVSQSYCPLNETVTANMTIFIPAKYNVDDIYIRKYNQTIKAIVADMSKQQGTKYLETIPYKVQNLSYRDVYNYDLSGRSFVQGCVHEMQITINFIKPEFLKSWAYVKLVFDRYDLLDVSYSKCGQTCQTELAAFNSVTLYNPLFVPSIKNMSKWDNQQYNYYTGQPKLYPLVLNFSFKSLNPGVSAFQIFVVSHHNGTIQRINTTFIQSTETYHGHYVGDIEIVSPAEYVDKSNWTTFGCPTNSNQNHIENQMRIQTMATQSISLLCHLLITAVMLCLVVCIVYWRTEAICIQKYIYLLLVLLEWPLLILLIVQAVSDKICLLLYTCVLVCSRDISLKGVSKYKLVASMLYSSRFYCLTQFNMLPIQVHKQAACRMHSIHLSATICINLLVAAVQPVQLKDIYFLGYELVYLVVTLVVLKHSWLVYIKLPERPT